MRRTRITASDLDLDDPLDYEGTEDGPRSREAHEHPPGGRPEERVEVADRCADAAAKGSVEAFLTVAPDDRR